MMMQLANIEIHIITNTNNRSDVYVYQNSTCILQKLSVLVLFYENSISSRSMKLIV